MMRTVRAWVMDRPSSDSSSEDQVLSLESEGILVVADGFGGTNPGSEAARLACDSIRDFLKLEGGDREATLPFVLRPGFTLPGNVLLNSIVHANSKLAAANRGRNVHEKGGASVVAAYLDGSLLSLASVGACSSWFFRDGRAAPLLTPRTWGRLIDPTTRSNSLDARLPLLALGLGVDLEPEVVEMRVRPGDCLWVGTFEPSPEELQVWAAGGREWVSDFTKNKEDSTGYEIERTGVFWGF